MFLLRLGRFSTSVASAVLFVNADGVLWKSVYPQTSVAISYGYA